MLRITDVAKMARMSRAEIEKMISRRWYKPSHATSPGRWRQYSALDVVLLSAIHELKTLGLSSQDAAHYVGVELRQELQRSLNKPIPSRGWFFFIARHDGEAKYAETVGTVLAADICQVFQCNGFRSALLVDVAKIVTDALLMIDARRPGGMSIQAAAEVMMRNPHLRRALTNVLPAGRPSARA